MLPLLFKNRSCTDDVKMWQEQKSGTRAVGECVTDVFTTNCEFSSRAWTSTNHSARSIFSIEQKYVNNRIVLFYNYIITVLTRRMLVHQWIKHQIHFTLTYFIKLLVHFHPPLQEIRHSISGCAVTHGTTCYWSRVLLAAEI